MNKYHYYQSALAKKREQKEYHQLRCVTSTEESYDKSRINFASNDFLGLSGHPYVKKTTIKYVLEWGAGTTSSRLVTGHLECHRSVEEKLTALVGKEGALLFPSAYQTHEQILSTLMDKRSTIFIDRFCHHGLMQAAINSGAELFRYEHNNISQLIALLEKAKGKTSKWIVTESLFGISGETADLKKLAEVAEKHDALTFVDDSNSVGMLGKHGMGLASHKKGIDVIFGSFGKQLGSFGAYLATNQLLREYLLAFNPQLIETTMLPPAVLGAISAALDLIPDMQVERQKVESLSQTLRNVLQENHWDIGNGTSHLVPLICSNDAECQKLTNALLKANIVATPLRPPLVPQGAIRLRFAINALHGADDISFLATTLQNLKEEPSFSIL